MLLPVTVFKADWNLTLASGGADCPAFRTGRQAPAEQAAHTCGECRWWDRWKFDSKIWPVAIGMLGAKLGISIANDVNIFRQDDSSIALTIDEIVAKVVALVEAQAVVEPKQASAQ